MHFVSEQPKYTVTRITPDAETALQNNLTCQGNNTIWTIEVKNTSQFTTLDRIDVEVKNPNPSALSLLHDVNFTQCTAPWLLQYYQQLR